MYISLNPRVIIVYLSCNYVIKISRRKERGEKRNRNGGFCVEL